MPKDFFMRYEAVETPVYESALFNKPIDISDWAEGYTTSGNVILNESPAAKELKSKFNLDYENVEDSPILKHSVNEGMTGSKKKAVDFFINKGLSPHAAAGIVGNLMHESSGLQTTIPGDGGLAYGIAQWHPDRLKGLEKLAKLLGTKKSDFYTLLEYVWKELNTKNTTENKALLKLLNAATVEEATDAFMRYYERPNLKKANFEARLKHARSCLS